MKQDEIDSELSTAGAQALLDSTSAAHLAYTAEDGTPRVVPVGYFWTGAEFVVCTAPKLIKSLCLGKCLRDWVTRSVASGTASPQQHAGWAQHDAESGTRAGVGLSPGLLPLPCAVKDGFGSSHELRVAFEGSAVYRMGAVLVRLAARHDRRHGWEEALAHPARSRRSWWAVGGAWGCWAAGP